MTTLFIGVSRGADSLASYLISSGMKISILSPTIAELQKLEAKIQEDVEIQCPMVYVDDLKHQEKLFNEKFKRISIINDLDTNWSKFSNIFISDSKTHANYSDRLPKTLPIFSLEPKIGEDKFGIEVYEPLRKTKTIKITTLKEPNSLLNIAKSFLISAGLNILTTQEGSQADRILQEVHTNPHLRNLLNSSI